MKAFKKVSGLVVLLMMINFFLQPLQYATAQTARASDQVTAPVINVNAAGIDELQAIRGIGPALAERIVMHRESNGKYKSLEDLKQVKGIGDAKLEKMKSQISF